MKLDNKVNDYDKFAKMRQEELLKGEKKPHRFAEKPMMRSMLKDLKGKKVLMLGCGTGEESKLLKEFGAKDIVGIDLSKVSIKLAKETYPEYNFVVGDMHNLPFEDNSFDFIYSSLVIHYSDKPEKVYQEIYRILKDDGYLLFSVGHPLRWSLDNVLIDNKECRVIGYENSNTENKIYGNYNTFSKRNHYFPNNEVLSFYVGSPSMQFKLLKKCGFQVEDFSESACIEETKEVDYNYWYKYHELPQFMAFLAKK